jgi:hypothetical protein
MLKASFSRAHRATIIGIAFAAAVSLLSAGNAAAGGKGSCKRTNTCSTTDTTAPAISISTPAAGSPISGSVTVSGTATDNVSVTSVAVSIDGGSYAGASGTAPWSLQLNTSAYANSSHTIYARATDTSGNTKVISEVVSINNVASPSPSPTPTTSSSPTATPSPTQSVGHMVTPEGVTININSAGSWTTDQIYSMLKASALELSTIGPHLTIEVQDTAASSCAASASTTNGLYTGFQAIIYLKGLNSTFSVEPDAQLTHLYGHAWTLYHLYMTHQGDWSSYLNTRWTRSDGSVTLAKDSRLDSSYVWSRVEIIAEDYRLLFGSSLAKSERPTPMNTDIPEPTDQPGLSDFFLNTWK